MVAQTSIKALAGMQDRKRKVDIVFDCLLFFMAMGYRPTAKDVALSTGLSTQTVCGRIDDLRRGYESQGEIYYLVNSGAVKAVGDRERATYALVTTDPVNREEQKAQIINRIKRDFSRLKQIDVAAMRELKNLFD